MVRWAALGILGAGCGVGSDPNADDGDDGLDGCASGDIGLEVGTGAEGYVPLVSGDHVQIVHGPQGGWHIETAGLVLNSEQDIAILPAITSGSIGDITGEQQPEYKALVDYDDTECSGTFYATRAFVSATRPTGPTGQAFVCSLEGESVTFSVLVQDIVSARETTAEVDVVLDLDPSDVPLCP